MQRMLQKWLVEVAKFKMDIYGNLSLETLLASGGTAKENLSQTKDLLTCIRGYFSLKKKLKKKKKKENISGP